MILRPRRPLDLLVVHHSASLNTTTAREIGQWHAARFTFGLGYHIVVEADGYPVTGRRLQRVPAANRGWNRTSITVCLTGDNTRSEPGYMWTGAQEAQLDNLIRFYTTWLPGLMVCGHRDLPGAATECPGISMEKWCVGRGLNVPIFGGS